MSSETQNWLILVVGALLGFMVFSKYINESDIQLCIIKSKTPELCRDSK